MLYTFYYSGKAQKTLDLLYQNTSISKTIRPSTIETRIKNALTEFLHQIKSSDNVENLQFNEESSEYYTIKIQFPLNINVSKSEEQAIIDLGESIVRQELNTIDKNWELVVKPCIYSNDDNIEKIKTYIIKQIEYINELNQNYDKLDINELIKTIYKARNTTYKYIFGDSDLYVYDNQLIGRHFGGIDLWKIGGYGSPFKNATEEELEKLDQSFADTPTNSAESVICRFVQEITDRYYINPEWTNHWEKGWSSFKFDKKNRFMSVKLTEELCNAITNNFLFHGDYLYYNDLKKELKIPRSVTNEKIHSIVTKCVYYQEVSETEFKYILFALKTLLIRIEKNAFDF